MQSSLRSVARQLSLPLFMLIFSSTSYTFAASAYVGNFQDNNVNAIDLQNKKITATLDLIQGPEGMGVTPDGRFVYVAESNANTIKVIDATQDKVIASIVVGSHPKNLVVTANGKQVLVAVEDANSLAYIDTATQKVTDNITLNDAHDVTLNSDNTQAIASSHAPNQFAFVVIDVARKKIMKRISLQRAPELLRYGPNDKYIYMTVMGVDAVLVWDAKTYTQVKQIPTAPSPYALAFTHDGRMGLTASLASGMLYLFNPQTNTVTDKIFVGKKPYWIAISRDDRFAYITDTDFNTVSIVDLTTKKVVDLISVGNAPHQVVLQ